MFRGAVIFQSCSWKGAVIEGSLKNFKNYIYSEVPSSS